MTTGNPLAGATVTVTDTRTGAARTHHHRCERHLQRHRPRRRRSLHRHGQSSRLPGPDRQRHPNLPAGQHLRSPFAPPSAAAATIVVTGSRVQVTQLAVGPGTASPPKSLRTRRASTATCATSSASTRASASTATMAARARTAFRASAATTAATPSPSTASRQGDVYGLNDTGFSSRSSTPIPYDAVRETQVQFAPFDVEYGNFTGCAINVVTKSGTNEYPLRRLLRIFGQRPARRTSRRPRHPHPVAPIEPDKRWGAALGGPIINDRLFFFGAYEHQDAGQSQDDGPAGARLRQPADRHHRRPVQRDHRRAEQRLWRRNRPAGHQPPVQQRSLLRARAICRSPTTTASRRPTSGSRKRSTKPDDLFTGSSPQAVGRNTFYLSGTNSDYYSGRLYSNWTDNFSTELRFSRSDGDQDLQDPIGGGEAQSRQPDPAHHRRHRQSDRHRRHRARRAGQLALGQRPADRPSISIAQLAKLTAGNHRLKFGVELNHADLFNLFVQNATGTLVFRNIDDLQRGPAFARPRQQPDHRPRPATSSPARPKARSATSRPPATSTMPRRCSPASIYSVFAQDDWQVTDRLNVVMGVRVDWYDGGHPEP